jgi:DNA mismatch repair ATPase MutL
MGNELLAPRGLTKEISMRRILVASTFALALGLGTGVAYAQSSTTQDTQGTQGGAASGCEAGATDCSGSTQGGSSEGQQQSTTGSQGNSGDQEQTTPGMKTEPNTQGKTQSDQSDQNVQSQTDGSTGQKKEGQSGASQEQSTPSNESGTQGQTNSGEKSQTGTETKTKSQDNSSSDQSESGSTTSISVEQRTEVHNIIKEEKVTPVNRTEVHISVGTAVPKTIELHRLPPRIIKIVPAYKSYEYFVLDDGTIIIVDPDTLKIVAVLNA